MRAGPAFGALFSVVAHLHLASHPSHRAVASAQLVCVAAGTISHKKKPSIGIRKRRAEPMEPSDSQRRQRLMRRQRLNSPYSVPARCPPWPAFADAMALRTRPTNSLQCMYACEYDPATAGSMQQCSMQQCSMQQCSMQQPVQCNLRWHASIQLFGVGGLCRFGHERTRCLPNQQQPLTSMTVAQVICSGTRYSHRQTPLRFMLL